jgi:hypothetical protein
MELKIRTERKVDAEVSNRIEISRPGEVESYDNEEELDPESEAEVKFDIIEDRPTFLKVVRFNPLVLPDEGIIDKENPSNIPEF